MMPDGFNPPGVWQPTGKFSLAVVEHEGKRVHLCGQASLDENGAVVGVGDIELQARTTLSNIQAILGGFGGKMSDIVSMYLYVTDIAALDAIHKVRGEFFAEPYPVSAGVEVSALVYPELLVEIAPIAVIPYERFRQP